MFSHSFSAHCAIPRCRMELCQPVRSMQSFYHHWRNPPWTQPVWAHTGPSPISAACQSLLNGLLPHASSGTLRRTNCVQTVSRRTAEVIPLRQPYSASINDLVHAIDEQWITGLVMLDLSATIDTVSHSILLWFRSYLSNRTQTFHINGTSYQLPVSCSVPQGSSAGPVEFIAYTEDVSKVFNRHGVQHHLYAHDKQVYVDTPVSNVPTARATLQSCIRDVGGWCSSRRLQLNEIKTELIWFGSKKILGKVPESELHLTVDATTIQPVSSVRDLGVHLDSELSVRAHVSKVASSCFYQLHRLWQIRHLVGQEVTAQLVYVFILSRLDYCNSVLASLPWCTTEPLQRVLIAAAWLILNLHLHNHGTPALQQLHWLLIEYRITYKLCLTMHLVHINRAPQYLSDCIQTFSCFNSRPGLRSSDTSAYAKPKCRTRSGERGFCYTGPNAWNSLPDHLHQISDTSLFKRRLKTELFHRAYLR